VKAAAYQRIQFAARYTAADVTLLAYVDKAHGNLSGPATRRILQREYNQNGQAAYQRLATISVAICTGCATLQAIANATPATRPHGTPSSPSANGTSPSRKACPDSCASTRYTREIRMGGWGCIASTRSTR
jgi:hypothetical protein